MKFAEYLKENRITEGEDNKIEVDKYRKAILDTVINKDFEKFFNKALKSIRNIGVSLGAQDSTIKKMQGEFASRAVSFRKN